MKDGAIDGQGTQAELAKSCETYNELLANMGTVEQGMLRFQRSGDPVLLLAIPSPTFHMARTEPEEKPKEEMKEKKLTKKQSRRKKKDVCYSSSPTSSRDAIG
jgi:hypothetical protein